MNPEFPRLVGIVNVTDDSFSDGGRFLDASAAEAHAAELIADGADMLDIGGESARPGASDVPVPVDIEITRVVDVISRIHARFPHIPLSIDTRKADVARAAVVAGARVINDVSAGRFDPAIFDVAAEHKLPLILMHMQGEPRSMQDNPSYENVSAEVFDFLHDRIIAAKSAGVEHIIADVGIGFGKSVEHNLQLLRDLPAFHQLGVPLMLGISRKRFLGTISGIQHAAERDVVTALMHALLMGARVQYIRVHNVALLHQLRKLVQALNG